MHSTCQSMPRTRTAMTRLVILLLLFEFIYVKTTRVVDSTNLIDTIDLLLDKVDKFELRDEDKDFVESDVDYDVDLEKAEALRILTSEQVAEFNKAIQESGKDVDEDKGDKADDGEDDIWPDYELDYAMDGSDDWDADEEIKTSSQPPILSPTSHAKPAPALIRYVTKVPVFIDPIVATNERPRILDDSTLSEKQRKKLRHQVMEHLKSVLRTGQCSVPQPRWLRVRQLAPAANIVYSPSCVMLHRCAPDSGCCHNENEICAPMAGHYVSIPFSLHTVSLNDTVARMEFYNHTRCGCITRDAMLHRAMSRVGRDQTQEVVQWRGTEAPATEFSQTKSMDVLENDEQPTEAPMRRCICPTLFQAKMTDKGCKCLCDWPRNSRRRRDCLSLARGLEHFGMRDRECINQGVCNSPLCDFGPYDTGRGTCPLRRSRWLRNKIRMAQERQPSN